MKRRRQILGPTVVRGEAGQGLAELVLILPLILIFVAGVLFFGRALYVSIALEAAAADAARASVETLNPWRGIPQGLLAARLTLEGYGLDARDARIELRPLATWSYGTPVLSRVRYRVYVGDIPLVNWFFPARSLQLESRAYSRVEEYKSRWAW